MTMVPRPGGEVWEGGQASRSLHDTDEFAVTRTG